MAHGAADCADCLLAEKTQSADCEQAFTFDKDMGGLARVKLP